MGAIPIKRFDCAACIVLVLFLKARQGVFPDLDQVFIARASRSVTQTGWAAAYSSLPVKYRTFLKQTRPATGGENAYKGREPAMIPPPLMSSDELLQLRSLNH